MKTTGDIYDLMSINGKEHLLESTIRVLFLVEQLTHTEDWHKCRKVFCHDSRVSLLRYIMINLTAEHKTYRFCGERTMKVTQIDPSMLEELET